MNVTPRLVVSSSCVVAGALLVGACFSSSSSGGGQPGPDGGADVEFDGAPADTTMDVAMDVAMDAPSETAMQEAASDGPGPGPEGGLDSAADAANDSPAVGTSYYVDPANGSDGNAGTSAAPFKSILHAAAVINAPDAGTGPFNVYLAGGTYDASNQTSLTVSFSNTTNMIASAPGTVTITGVTGGGGQENFVFQQGGSVQNVTFQNTWYGVEGRGGTFAVSGCSFSNAGGGGYVAAFVNGTVGTFDTSGGATLSGFTGTLGAVYVDNTAKVTWTGGGFSLSGGTTGVNLVFVRGGGQITIDGVSVSNYPGYVAVGYDQANITVQNSTIAGSGWASGVAGLGSGGVFWMGASQSGVPSTSLTLTNTSVTGSQGSAVAYVLSPNAGTLTFKASGSHLDNSTQAGIWVTGNPNAALVMDISGVGTTFDGNGAAAIYAPAATVSLSGTGSSVSSNGAGAAALGLTPGGIVLTSAAWASSVSARGTTFNGNTGNQIDFTGSTSSSLDLGTSASTGGNTFSAVPASSSALSLNAAIAASAIGNTWMPGVQGADASGHYTTTTTLTGPASGQNVTEPTGASVVMAP